ncbi:hypothetical protein GCM10009565_52080 [Amycolatopsis albidoflavus]
MFWRWCCLVWMPWVIASMVTIGSDSIAAVFTMLTSILAKKLFHVIWVAATRRCQIAAVSAAATGFPVDRNK